MTLRTPAASAVELWCAFWDVKLWKRCRASSEVKAGAVVAVTMVTAAAVTSAKASREAAEAAGALFIVRAPAELIASSMLSLQTTVSIYK